MDLHGWNEVEGAMEEVFVLLAFYFSFHTIHVVIVHFNEKCGASFTRRATQLQR
jgi:hypothetical protein